jgi:hypothetical protein
LLGGVACDLGVEPPPDTPLLALSAREVNLFVIRGSPEPDEVTLQISNNGRGTLTGLRVEGPVYGESASDWLDVSLEDSTLTLIAQAVTGADDTLSIGTYHASLSIAADGVPNSPRGITVNLEVGKSQQIALAVGEVTFAAQATDPVPPRQTVAVSNAGEGVLSELAIDSIVYRDGGLQGWLEALLSQTRAPTLVELQPNAVPTTETTLQATVFVGSRIADPSLDSIRVEYIVAPPPTLVISTHTLEIEAERTEPAPPRWAHRLGIQRPELAEQHSRRG